MTDSTEPMVKTPPLDQRSVADLTASWTDREWEAWFRETVLPSWRWHKLRTALVEDTFTAEDAQKLAVDKRTGKPDPDLQLGLAALSTVLSRSEHWWYIDGKPSEPVDEVESSARDFTTLSAEAKRRFMSGWNRVCLPPPENADSIVPELTPLTPWSRIGRNWRLWAIPIVFGGFIVFWAWVGGFGTENEARTALSETPSPSVAVAATPTGTEVPSVATPVPTTTGVPVASHPLAFGDATLDAVLSSAGLFSVGYDALRLDAAVDLPDELGGWSDSISSSRAAYRGDDVDIRRTVSFTVRVSQGQVDAAFNRSALECYQPEPLVVCAPGVLPMPAGDLLVVAVQDAAAIPTASSERSYVYALALDSDGDPANNWQPQPPFDWDYFGGTDRWYQATYDHLSGAWAVLLTQLRPDGVDTVQPTAARAVVYGKWVVWFVPVDELPGYPSPLRVTAFGHDGAYTQSSRGGDVSGANPTEPLIVPPPLPAN